jgi:hypothetical protein
MGDELVHADGWTDEHDEVNGRLSQYCECAQIVVQLKYILHHNAT